MERIILQTPRIPYFEDLKMRNFQHEIRICQKNHNKGTMTYQPSFFSQLFDSYLLIFLSSKGKKTSYWSKKVCFLSLPVEKEKSTKTVK